MPHQASLNAIVRLAAQVMTCETAFIAVAGTTMTIAASCFVNQGTGGVTTSRNTQRLIDPIAAERAGFLFYCGIPLRSYCGFELGRLVVLGSERRSVEQKDLASLMLMSQIAADLIAV